MSSKKVEKNLISTIEYFTFFKYPPDFEEIYTFYPKKIGKIELRDNLNLLIKKQKIIQKASLDNVKRYTPWEYQKLHRQYSPKVVSSAQKIKSIKKYSGFLSILPQIKLIGLSGSVAMANARQDDDIDLFVITGQNRLWTGRFLALILASLWGRRRRREESHVNNKICLNLFFEETGLKIHAQKRSKFVAHEVLQMKPLADKQKTHSRFLGANSWVFKLFPNAARSTDKFLTPSEPLRSRKVRSRKNLLSSLADLIELTLKKLQLALINRHKTSEIIGQKQLWFFPDDFEKKLKIKP